MEIFTSIAGNWSEIAAVLVAVHGLAIAIVNATPTPVDNKLYGKVYKVVEVLAGIFSFKAKELPGESDLLKAAAEDTEMSDVDSWLGR